MKRTLLVGLAGAALAGPAAAQSPCASCSVLWITVDTLRADRVGVYGNPDRLTPAIDRLAARGRVMIHAVPSGPQTIQSVPAYFSSRHRFHTGMLFDLSSKDYTRLPTSVITLAEALRGAGLRTAAYYANPVLGWPVENGGRDRDPFQLAQGFDGWTFGNDEGVEKGAVGWLRERGDERFFLYLHFMGPHDPNAEGPGFAERRGTFQSRWSKDRRVDYDDYMDVRQAKVAPTAEDLRYVRALYDDAVLEADARVGRVLAALDAAGRADDTVVVVTSDHGEALGERFEGHPWLGHGHNLRDELLRVPLVLAGPGVPVGVDRTNVTELIDVAPTLLGLVGVRVDPAWGWDGRPFLGPGAVPGTSALAEFDPSGQTWGSAEDGRYRVLAPRAGGEGLRYDRVADPLQEKPLPPGREVDALLTVRRDAWARARPPAAERVTRDAAIDPAQQCQLIQLGYVDASTLDAVERERLRAAGCPIE